METHSYGDMEALQKGNWWYVSRRELIKALVDETATGANIALDLGCGVGSNASALVAPGRELIGLDAEDEALARAKTHGYARLMRSGADSIPLPAESVDLVLAADVLEHVNDKRALAEIFRVLRPGGRLILTVPAHRWLWNWNDDYSHHLRRYGRQELHERLTDAGFVPLRLTSWNISFVLPVWLVSLTQRMRRKPERLENNLNTLPGWVNGMLLSLMRIENRLALNVGLPIGVSLVAVGAKPDVMASSNARATAGT